MRNSETQAAISVALVAALSELKGALKDSKNPHFKNDYASLESVVETVRPVLAAHKLGVIQGPGEMHGNALTVTTRIIHESGEWIESDFQIPLAKLDPQSAGSAVTYARRYALMGMLNLPALDDDGETAQGRGAGPAPLPPTPAAAPRNGNGPSPEGEDWWACEGPGMTAHAAKKDGLDMRHEDMRSAIGALATAAEWREWCRVNTPEIAKMPKSWRVILRAEAQEMAEQLGVDFNNRRAA